MEVFPLNRLALMILKNFWKVPWAYGKLCYYAKHTDKYPEQVKWDHIRYIMKLAVRDGNLDLQVHGVENLPKEGGFLLYSNHQGLFDVVALVAACEIPLGCVFKKELANIPFLKQVVSCTKSFSMDRDDVRQSFGVIQNVYKEVAAGRNYLIFPEGTRSKNGNEMLEFHAGSFACAIKAKKPVIPMALINSFKVLDQKGCAPVTVQLHFLDPIMPEEYQGMKSPELAKLVQSRIAETIKNNT